tara:strand:+ start:6433 stop:6807 length:375 start_codon:yes stop_codon:yes gene_type:complete
MAAMEPEYISLYRHVMVLYWPWLWWQLRIITRWRIETGRALLIAADRTGNIYIRAVGDDPRAPRPGIIKAPVSDRLRFAIDGEPAPYPCSRRTPGPQAIEVMSHAARDPGFRLEYGIQVPIPDI